MVKVINYFLLIPFIMVIMTVIIINQELMNEVISGKYFWFYFWMGVVSLTVPISYCLNRCEIKVIKIDLLILVLGGIGFASSYIYGDINTRTILFILPIILYFYFRIIISANFYNKNILFFFLVITGLIEVIWGIKQLYGLSSTYNVFIITGSFFNSGPYSGYLSVIAPIALYYVLQDYRFLKAKLNIKVSLYYLRWFLSFLTFIAIISILPATMSRASWISFIGGCTIIVISFLWSEYNLKTYIRKCRKQIKIVTLLVVLIGVIGGVQIYQLKKDSADGRLLMWKVSAKAIPNHPLGVGLGHFPGVYANQQANYFSSGKGSTQEQFVAGNPEYAFNEYLQICIEMGIIPFLLFMSVIIIALYSGYKNKFYPEFASLISLLIFASMSYPFNCLPFLIVLVLLLAACVTNRNKQTINKNKTSHFVLFISILILSGSVILCVYNRYPTYEAYKDWKYAKKLSDMGDHWDSKVEYERNFSLLKDQSYFLFGYAHILSQLGDYEKSNEILQIGVRGSSDPMFYNIMGKNYQVLKEYDKAEECFLKSSYIIPNRHYPLYLLAKLYEEKGDLDKAKKMAKHVIEKEPKVHSGAIEDMKNEMKEMIEKE